MYSPRTITVGLIISATSVVIFIALLILDRFFKFGCKDRRPLAILEADAPTDEASEARLESDNNADKATSEDANANEVHLSDSDTDADGSQQPTTPDRKDN